MSSYLSYWKPINVDWSDPRRVLLDHTAGNQLKSVGRGDRLYLITYSDGMFYLLGCITVDAVVSQKHAARRLGCKPSDLW